MPPDIARPAAARSGPVSSAIGDVVGIKERSFVQTLFANQALWVALAVALIMTLMSLRYPDQYGTEENFFNITRNFSFIGIMALGMTAVIITGGIDLSVGSVMGVVGIVVGLIMHAGDDVLFEVIMGITGLIAAGLVAGMALRRSGRAWPVAAVGGVVAGAIVGGIVYWLIATFAGGWAAVAGNHWAFAVYCGLGAGVLCGLINGGLITGIGLPPFVTTLATLAALRSTAVVLSQNKMIYQLGPSSQQFFDLFGGQFIVANSVWLLVLMTAGFAFVLNATVWGRHLFAIGGNEQAAQLTGVPVVRVKLQAYVFCSLCAAVAAIMLLGWQGSAINALGTGYELRVIASTVIGGTNLIGGEGGALGAFVGAALIEVIRNGLILAGVDSSWQGIFVGAFIILAVLLERVRGRKRE
jgi:ribose transport system permease protein